MTRFHQNVTICWLNVDGDSNKSNAWICLGFEKHVMDIAACSIMYDNSARYPLKGNSCNFRSIKLTYYQSIDRDVLVHVSSSVNIDVIQIIDREYFNIVNNGERFRMNFWTHSEYFIQQRSIFLNINIMVCELNTENWTARDS